MTNRVCRRGAERGTALQVIFWILAGIVLLIALVALVAVWAVRTYVDVQVTETDEGKRVEISTPFGEMVVEEAREVADRLKLPVYPGAEATGEGGSMHFRARGVEEEGGLSVTGAEFLTSDSLDEVDAWYREQLGSEFERKEGEEIKLFEDEHGWLRDIDVDLEGVGYFRESAGRVRGVVLQPRGIRVEIGLFELRPATRQ